MEQIMKIIKILPAIAIAAFFTSTALADYARGEAKRPSDAEEKAIQKAAAKCDPDADEPDVDDVDVYDWEIYRNRRGNYVVYVIYECD